MYGVVVCSRCRRAKGVRIGQKTTRCQCGHNIDLSIAKIKSHTNDARELAKAVAMENVALRGGRKEYERAAGAHRKLKGAHGRTADAAAGAGNREHKIRAVAVELTRELGDFTARDFALVLVSLGIPAPQTRLEELLKLNLIYEPRPGHYRVV